MESEILVWVETDFCFGQISVCWLKLQSRFNSFVDYVFDEDV